MIKLGVGAIFKNESHIIEEWINHYLREGADKFILIDNGSKKEYDSTKIIEKYKEVCVLYRDEARYKQIEHYNKYFKPHIRELDWLIIVDLDEFMYSRGPFDTIKDYILTLPKTVSQVRVPWKVFSSNNFIFQPPLVVPFFVTVGRYDVNTKAFVRVSDAYYFDIHVSYVRKGQTVYPFKVHEEHCKTKDLFCKCQNFCLQGKHLSHPNYKILNQYLIHLNHYQIQSWEFFRNVKMTRGDGFSKILEPYRNEKNYFNKSDKNIIIDDELKNKHYSDIPLETLRRNVRSFHLY